MKPITFFLVLSLILLTSLPVIAGNAPDFTLKDLNGKKHTLTKLLKDGPILIDFWATWCKSCLHEMPELDKIGQKYAEKGLRVVAISVDSPKSSAKVRPFIKSSGYDFIVLLDSKSEVRKMFGGTSTPYTALISQSGETVYTHIGYVPGDELLIEAEVAKLFESEGDNSTDKTIETGE